MTSKHIVRLALPARNDLLGIREFGEERFGMQTADEYERLIRQAINDIRADPLRPGSKERPELGIAFRSYHISFSRNRAKSKIKKPRHFLIYYKAYGGIFVISRILKDSMDLQRHIPNEHKDESLEN